MELAVLSVALTMVILATLKCAGEVLLRVGSDNAVAKHEDDDGGHPSQEIANRHPDDIRLRAFGFQVKARPGDGEATWVYRPDEERYGAEAQVGQVLPQSEALRSVLRGQQRRSFPA